jgi:hypothetical protein
VQHKLAHPTSTATATTAASAAAGDTTAGAAADGSVLWQLRALTARRRDLTRRNSCSLEVCNARKQSEQLTE